MNIWTEYHKSSTEHFGFWKPDDRFKYEYIKSISIEAEKIFQDEDEESLIFHQKNFIKRVFNTNEYLSNYKLYMLLFNGVSAPVKSIERYKKLWKRLEKNHDFSELIKGEEVEILVEKGSIFCSVAEFNIEEATVVLKIMNKMSSICAIIITKTDLMNEGEIENLFKTALLSDANNHLVPEVYKIDFRQLCLSLCTKGDIVVRLGDASEETSLAMFFDERYHGYLYKNMAIDKTIY